jgi:glutaredoxin 2
MKTPMTPDRAAALADINRVIGQEDAKQTQAQQWSLLDVFFSVPYLNRGDGQILAETLRPAVMVLDAVDRSECRKTFASSPELQAILRKISTRAADLAGV